MVFFFFVYDFMKLMVSIFESRILFIGGIGINCLKIMVLPCDFHADSECVT